MCDQCPMVYLNKTRLKQHIDCVHTGRYQNNVVNKGLDYIDSIKCSSCYETFSAGNHYIQHHQAIHGGIAAPIQLCYQLWLALNGILTIEEKGIIFNYILSS